MKITAAVVVMSIAAVWFVPHALLMMEMVR